MEIGHRKPVWGGGGGGGERINYHNS